MKPGKIITHIPARGGSKRVPSKNLRYLAGKPMISYAIEAAVACSELGDVYVNTDSEELESLGQTLGCKVYRRPAHLGTDDASGEDFTVDFIKAFKPETLVMISPVCPLIDSNDIKHALQAYANSPADTLISCSKTQMQTFFEDQPVNIEIHGPLAPSQKNPPIITCNWAITIWNAATFLQLYAQERSGYFGKDRIFWPLEPVKAIKVSEEKDFRLAEAIMMARRNVSSCDLNIPRYWHAGSGVGNIREGMSQ